MLLFGRHGLAGVGRFGFDKSVSVALGCESMHEAGFSLGLSSSRVRAQNFLPTPSSFPRIISAVTFFFVFFMAAFGTPAFARNCSPGFYTKGQARLGAGIYSRHCAECHGSTLAGLSAPALSGPNFKSFIAYSKMSALQLFQFINSQMPNNAPGSLTKSQYIEVLSYILKQNNYPLGTVALSSERLGCIALLPFPKERKSRR